MTSVELVRDDADEREGLVDAHCHLSHGGLDAATVARMVERARGVGVSQVVMTGTCPDDWAQQVALNAQHASLHPVFGWHPWEVAGGAGGLDLASLVAQCTAYRPVAIGETGLDRSTPAGAATEPLQLESLRRHLELARSMTLPVVLHVVRGHGAVLELLAAEGIGTAGGMVHGFSGSREVALAYVKRGLHVSFSCRLTDPRARRLREAAQAVPLQRLLVETDAPDQRPTARTCGLGEPADLPHVIAELAALRGISPQDVAQVTSRNAAGLFALPD